MPNLNLRTKPTDFTSPFFDTQGDEGYRLVYKPEQEESTSSIADDNYRNFALVLFVSDFQSRVQSDIFHKIDEGMADPEMYEEGEEKPTDNLIEEVKGLLRKTRPFGVNIDRQLPA